MAHLTYSNITITGLSACVPQNKIINRSYTAVFDAQSAADIVEKTGIEERRFAPEGMCASDLCYAAADKLLLDMEVDSSEIDVLIFVSQTPDYRMPATSVILQDRLGLSKNTAAFDINLGCSAFVYALSVAFGYASQPHVRKVLLLDGETRSRVYSAKDRSTAFLFGDAGVAALIEKQENAGTSWFSLHSDGSRADLIKADAGGFRIPSTPETLKERVIDEHGNIRTHEQGYMNGPDVFNFAIREVPKNVRETLAWSGCSAEEIEYFVFHQANQFMNGYLAQKLKLPLEKVPNCLKYFGNTSSVSIPLTIATQLQGDLKEQKKVLLCGFGVGMSWASAILDMGPCHIPDLIEI